MKYEAVFGDQSLFDGAPSDSTHTTKGGGFYRVTEDGGVQYLSRGPLNGDVCKCIGGHLIAERRIIPELKRWTLEDKKAGRLPEVGCECWHCKSKSVKSVIAVTATHIVINANNSVGVAPRFLLHDEFMQYYMPIETPEEKAQREEDEFVSLVESKYNHMPDEISFRTGIRAAYRKLKGGE